MVMRSSAIATIVAALALCTIGCGGSSSAPAQDGGARTDGGPNDGGSINLSASITADPAQGTAGQQSTFTATISGGTQPYSCNWVFVAGGSSEAGSVTGATCTGTHIYAQDGSYVVSVNVTDNRNHL